MSSTTHVRYILNYSLNFFSAILLIYISKWIFDRYDISGLTLTILNCFMSGIFSTITLRFLSKPMSNSSICLTRFQRCLHMLIISIIFSSFLTFSNLSLQYNTLGTYQLIKLQVPPTLMLFEWIQLRCKWNTSILTEEKFHRNYSFAVLIAFAMILLGTLVNTYSDLFFHRFGATYACISVISNGLYQVFVQNDRSISIYERTRFLQIQSFISAILLLFYWPFVESSNELLKWNWHIFGCLILCGFIAFLVNSSVIWCIKDDAAIGYNIVGQLKTLIIVFLGSFLFGEVLVIRQILSVLLTTFGCLFYVILTYRTTKSSEIL